MAGYANCIARMVQAAGRQLTDDEVNAIFTRIHKAALDIKAGRKSPADVTAGRKVAQIAPQNADALIQAAAARAADELIHEAQVAAKQAYLQVVKIGARSADVAGMTAGGLKPLEAVKNTIARDYRTNIESLEQRVDGHKTNLLRKLLPAWDALGNDWLGFFQNRTKLLNLVRELRGENSGDALAAKGAKAFHDVAEEARTTFNEAGGDIGRLDDWGMPQHHSQERVALTGRDAWVDSVLPMLDRARYVDDLGQPWPEARVREFLGKAWDTIATNGHANSEPGQFTGAGKRANRHGEHRQIHFKDADSVIQYWNTFGDRTAVEILHGHIGTMARDIAFIEHFGPNPNVTYQTLREAALKAATKAEPTKTPSLEGQAVRLDMLYDYAAGRMTPTANRTVSKIADVIANLNVAAKLGGAALASLFGDKPVMEAVSHMNDLPVFQRWRTELSVLNPFNKADRRLLQQQGLMLDSVRSGLLRIYEGLGQGQGFTGKIANAVMRVTGMQAINDLRKGAFGLSLMSAIGDQIKAGVDFGKLQDSDIRTLRNYGITEADWNTWRLAKLQDMGGGNDAVLTPESIARITEAELKAANIIGQAEGPREAQAARRNAIVKLLGAVNTESEFAIVTPGWRERAMFYGDLQRGTVKGEIARSVLQFKSFPWAYLQRGMDAVANQDAPASKAAMTAYLIASTTLAGAMIMQTREMLSGKDPRAMADENWWKFWGSAFVYGGALGIYGDFLYGTNQTRYGSGIVETLSGPTIGPLLELGLVQPMNAAKKALEGKETHLAAQTLQDVKGFVPGGNIWYTKAALDHLIWQQVMEGLSPGYMSSIRRRTEKDYNQSWWWEPGELTPERAPDLEAAISR